MGLHFSRGRLCLVHTRDAAAAGKESSSASFTIRGGRILFRVTLRCVRGGLAQDGRLPQGLRREFTGDLPNSKNFDPNIAIPKEKLLHFFREDV
jgi:hypothetical protein